MGVSSINFIIQNLRQTVSITVLRHVYCVSVQSRLTFGGSSAHVEKVFICHKKIIRCMDCKHYDNLKHVKVNTELHVPFSRIINTISNCKTGNILENKKKGCCLRNPTILSKL